MKNLNEMANVSDTTPDKTVRRYQVDQFKSTNCKKVPHEKLDFTIYKQSSNSVTFSSSEERLPYWIKTFYLRYYLGLNDNNSAPLQTRWDEESNQNDETKCVKRLPPNITCSENTKENYITFNIDILTGRILVKGRYVKEWGKEEFNKHGSNGQLA